MAVKRAIVVENLDPEGLGRIKVKLPSQASVSPEDLPWVDYCTPFGGWDSADGSGFFWIPPVGSQVWIEEIENTGTYVWLGQAFFKERGIQNPPIEAKVRNTEPFVRVIKSTRGHKLIFDDRIEDDRGTRPYDIQLLSANDNGLKISDNWGIRLALNQTRLELKTDSFTITTGDTSFTSSRNKWSLVAESGGIEFDTARLTIDSPRSVTINTSDVAYNLNGGFSVSANVGVVSFVSSGFKAFSSVDLSLGAAESLRLSGNDITASALLGGDITIQTPIAPLGGSSLTKVIISSEDGSFTARAGTGQAASADQVDAFATYRIRADGLTGNISIRSQAGGVYISGQPQLLSGSAGGSVRSVANISPTLDVSGPQPIPLGGNLKDMLEALLETIETLAREMLTVAPNFSTGGAGPNVLNPAVVSRLTETLSKITLIRTKHLNPTPVPTNILSSTVFIEG